jgi:acetyltransferase-like isoleucine patch superfamily enzyme
MSRARLAFYKFLGLSAGRANRIEKIRCRRLSQIVLGSGNALTEGCWLWPNDTHSDRPRIVIGNNNYFNRDVMIDACGEVIIGNGNMFGPGVYITDSDHGFEFDGTPGSLPMRTGRVKIGDNCWVGAKAIILKDVELGNNCVVAAGAVVTKSFVQGSVIAGVPAKLVRVLEPA